MVCWVYSDVRLHHQVLPGLIISRTRLPHRVLHQLLLVRSLVFLDARVWCPLLPQSAWDITVYSIILISFSRSTPPTSSPPTSTVISFPEKTAHSTSRADFSTTSITSSIPTSTKSAISSNSDYNYLSTVHSLLLNTLPPTSTHTITNPDQHQTTFSLLSVAPTAAPSAPPLPSGLPTSILAQPVLDPRTLPSSDVMISILLNDSLNWDFVARNPDSQGQIFLILPQIIATALVIDGMFLNTVFGNTPT